MKGALVVTFGTPKPGREGLAFEQLAETTEYWGKLAADGVISEPEFFASLATGRGIWVTKGELDVISDLAHGEEALGFNAKGQYIFDYYTSEIVLTGDSVDDYFGKFAKVMEKAAA